MNRGYEIVELCRALEHVCIGKTEERMGSLVKAAVGEPRQVVELNYHNNYSKDKSGVYDVLCGQLVKDLGLTKTLSPDEGAPNVLSIPRQPGVTVWTRPLKCPFNLLLNFEPEGRLRVGLRGRTPNDTRLLPDKVTTVYLFPNLADVTFYFYPPSALSESGPATEALKAKPTIMPAVLRQTAYSELSLAKYADGIFYAGLPTVLCQQVEWLHNRSLSEPDEKYEKRITLFMALYGKLTEEEKGRMMTVLVPPYINFLRERLLGEPSAPSAAGGAKRTRRQRGTQRKRTRKQRRRVPSTNFRKN
jgi:hypothetical protein